MPQKVGQECRLTGADSFKLTLYTNHLTVNDQTKLHRIIGNLIQEAFDIGTKQVKGGEDRPKLVRGDAAAPPGWQATITFTRITRR